MRWILFFLIGLTYSAITAQSFGDRKLIAEATQNSKNSEFNGVVQQLKTINPTPSSRNRKWYVLYWYCLINARVNNGSLNLSDTSDLNEFVSNLMVVQRIYDDFGKIRHRYFFKRYGIKRDSIVELANSLTFLQEKIKEAEIKRRIEDSLRVAKHLADSIRAQKKTRDSVLMENAASVFINEHLKALKRNPISGIADYRLTLTQAGPKGEDLQMDLQILYDTTAGGYVPGLYRDEKVLVALGIVTGTLKNQIMSGVQARGTIIGIADALRTTDNLVYENEWIIPKEIRYTDQWNKIKEPNISTSQVLSNQDLAFLRAYCAYRFINMELGARYGNLNINLETYTYRSKAGAGYRRVDVKLYFYDWLKENSDSPFPGFSDDIPVDFEVIIIENGKLKK